MKKCPYCAEEIQDEAIVCRYCGRAVIADEWREFCEAYAQQDDAQRANEWAKLSDDQRKFVNLAWKAL